MPMQGDMHPQRIFFPTPIRPCNISTHLENSRDTMVYHSEKRSEEGNRETALTPRMGNRTLLPLPSYSYSEGMDDKRLIQGIPYFGYGTPIMAISPNLCFSRSPTPAYSYVQASEVPALEGNTPATGSHFDYYPWNYMQPDAVWYKDAVESAIGPNLLPIPLHDSNLLRTPPSATKATAATPSVPGIVTTPTTRYRNHISQVSPASYGSTPGKQGRAATSSEGYKFRKLVFGQPITTRESYTFAPSSASNPTLMHHIDEAIPIVTPNSTSRSLPALVTPSPTTQSWFRTMNSTSFSKFQQMHSSSIAAISGPNFFGTRIESGNKHYDHEEDRKPEVVDAKPNMEIKKNPGPTTVSDDPTGNPSLPTETLPQDDLPENELVSCRKYAMSKVAPARSKFPQYTFKHSTQYQYTVTASVARKLDDESRRRQVDVVVRVMVGEKPGDVHVVAKDVCALLGKRVGSVGRATAGFSSSEKSRMGIALTDPSRARVQGDGDSANQRVNVQVMSVLSVKGLEKLVRRSRSKYSKQVGRWAIDQLKHFQRVDESSDATTQLSSLPYRVQTIPGTSTGSAKISGLERELSTSVLISNRADPDMPQDGMNGNKHTHKRTSEVRTKDPSSSLGSTKEPQLKRQKIDNVVRNLWPEAQATTKAPPTKENEAPQTSTDKGIASLLMLSAAATHNE